MRLADTSFFVALQVPRDANHAAARSLWERESGPVIVTNHVLGETWTWLRRRAGHAAASRFVTAGVGSPRLVLLHVDEAAEDEAWQWLHRHDEREYSFVDATSFAVMRRHRVREALAFEGDFTAAGYVELRP